MPMSERSYDDIFGSAWHAKGTEIRKRFTYIELDASPLGVVVPEFIGQTVFDTVDKVYYTSTGLTAADWTAAVAQGSVPIYATRAGLASLTIPNGITNITLNGYAATDDGGEGAYRRVLAGAVAGLPSQCYQQDASGAYWLDNDKEPQPQKYGVPQTEFSGDSSTAWNNYFAAMKALNRPVNVKTVLHSRITGAVACPAYGLVAGAVATGAHIDLHNVTFQYAGTRNVVAFKIGQTDLQLREAFIYLPRVVTSGALSWPGRLQTDDTGIQFVNVDFCCIFENFVTGFTKGNEYTGSAYNTIFGKHILDCKYGRVYTTYDSGATFTNENVVFGGRISCTSAANLLGNAYGQVFTWNWRDSYRGQNNNRFFGCTFEVSSAAGAQYRVPVLFDGAGAENWFEQCRVEGSKGPAMICSGGHVTGAGGPVVAFNVFKCSFNRSGGTTQSNSIMEINGAVGNRYEGPGSHVHHWAEYDLGKLMKSGGGAAAAYLKGRELFLKQGAAAISKRTTSASAIGSHRNAIMIANGTRVGTAVSTAKIKTFMSRNSTQDGFYGRSAIYCFDAAGVQLTGNITDSSATIGADDWLPIWQASKAYLLNQLAVNDSGKIYKVVTAGTSAGSGGPTGTGTGIVDNTVTWDYFGQWGTEQYVKGAWPGGQSSTLFSGGDPYTTAGDSVAARETWLRFRDEVQSAYIMIGGGTNSCVLRSLEIDGFSTMNIPGEAYPTVTGMTAMRVFSPLDDDGETIKVTADPVTAGGHGYYEAGDLMGISNAAPASAAAAMWFALTSGWLAPPWTISTAYAVPGQLVTNDTGKIYQLVTAGTSAGATGPTGTGTAIADNTCIWDYIGVKPTSGAINRA